MHGSPNIRRPTRRWSAWRRAVFRTRRICTARVHRRLFSAAAPADFDAWCLREAAKTGTNTEAATEFFLDMAAGGQNIVNWSDEVAEERLEHNPDLLASYRKRQQRRKHDLAEFTSRSAERKRQREAEAQQQQTEWRQLLNDQRAARG